MSRPGKGNGYFMAAKETEKDINTKGILSRNIVYSLRNAPLKSALWRCFSGFRLIHISQVRLITDPQLSAGIY